jgi:hypothetical protein
MKTFIINKLQNILGISALRDHCQAQVQARIEAESKLAAALKLLEVQLEDSPSIRDVERSIEEATENFITERGLNDSIEEALRDQDWDSIVSEALTDRHCSSVDEMVSDAISQAFDDGELDENVAASVRTMLEDKDCNLAQDIRTALNNLPVA